MAVFSLRLHRTTLQDMRVVNTAAICNPLLRHSPLVVAEADLPDLVTLVAQLADEFARLEIPQLDFAVIATSDDEAVVKLETGDGIVMR